MTFLNIDKSAPPDCSPSLDRRAALGSVAAVFSSLVLPPVVRSQDRRSYESAMQPRDLGRSYELWQRDVSADTLPPLKTFEQAIDTCRSSACGIHHVISGVQTGSHSGFLVSIPNEHMTARSRGMAYIVTCDHNRAFDERRSTIHIILSNGSTIHPSQELTEVIGKNGFPTKDLRVLEVNVSDVNGLKGLPLRSVTEPVRAGTPVVIYEPIGSRVSTHLDPSSGKVRPILFADDKPRLEKFVLTYVTDPAGPRQRDPNYPANTGLMTAGQLYSGGSGSPAVVFDKDTFSVGGYQVGYIPTTDTGESVNGELQCDGHVVHANNIISLLKRHGAWK